MKLIKRTPATIFKTEPIDTEAIIKECIKMEEDVIIHVLETIGVELNKETAPNVQRLFYKSQDDYKLAYGGVELGTVTRGFVEGTYMVTFTPADS